MKKSQSRPKKGDSRVQQQKKRRKRRKGHDESQTGSFREL
jgi:hypothetical protein